MAREWNKRSYLLRKGFKGIDTLVDTILDNPEGPEALLYKEAIAINDNKIKRKWVEASLLTCNDYQRIASLLELDVNLVEIYSKVFYEVHDLDLLSKIELLEKPRDKDEIILKTWALHQGLSFIAWRLGKSKQVDIVPNEGLVDLFNTCIYKSKEALFNGNSSTASVESTKWVKLSIEIARLLKLWILDSDSARKDIELAIKEVLPDFESLDDILVKEGVTVEPIESGQDK
jgi:hypothetical protein